MSIISHTSQGAITRDVEVEAAYITTGKAVQGEFPLYESYDKANLITGGNSNYCTFACFMRVPHATANYEGFFFGNVFCRIQTRQWGWYGQPYPYEPNTFYIDLNNSVWSDWYGITKGMADHGIDVGEWFCLMVSADLSGATGVVQTWVHKVGENFATDISVVTPLDDESPIMMEFDATGGSITAMNSHPWFTSQSLDSENSEVYFTNELVDWSDQNVRDLFVHPVTGKPVGLTTGGENLTGSVAAYYLRGGDGTNNEGYAGNFTEVGTIDNSTTSPSD